MNFWESILLGIVQGATEFLPVSSSGHLVLGHTLLGMQEPELLFDIILHVGTLLAVIAFYRRDVFGVITGMRDGVRSWLEHRSMEALFEPEGMRLSLMVVIASVPTALIGLGLEKIIDPDDGASLVTPALVCGLLIINGFILAANRGLMQRETKPKEGLFTIWNLGIAAAIGVGIAQGFAVMPGISRSGTTITMALLLGVSRPDAARFSFLLSIPAIVGAVVLKFDPSVFAGEQGGAIVLSYLAGAVTAGIVGYLCIVWLVALLKNARFHHFAWYCWAVGIIGVAYFG